MKMVQLQFLNKTFLRGLLNAIAFYFKLISLSRIFPHSNIKPLKSQNTSLQSYIDYYMASIKRKFFQNIFLFSIDRQFERWYYIFISYYTCHYHNYINYVFPRTKTNVTRVKRNSFMHKEYCSIFVCKNRKETIMFNVIYIKNKYTKFSYMAMTFTS